MGALGEVRKTQKKTPWFLTSYNNHLQVLAPEVEGSVDLLPRGPGGKVLRMMVEGSGCRLFTAPSTSLFPHPSHQRVKGRSRHKLLLRGRRNCGGLKVRITLTWSVGYART